MKRISSYFAVVGREKRPKSLASGSDETDDSTSDGVGDKAQEKSADQPQSAANPSAPRKPFQKTWLTDSKYKDWLLYDEKKNHMTCSFCIKSKRQNPFTVGCTNYRTSTLTRHMSSADHVNSMKDSVEQVNFRRTYETAFENKKSAIVSAMRCVYWLAQEKIATVKYSSLINLMKVQPGMSQH